MLDLTKLELTPEEMKALHARAATREAVARAQLAKALDGIVAWLRERAQSYGKAHASELVVLRLVVALEKATRATGLEWPVKEAK